MNFFNDFFNTYSITTEITMILIVVVFRGIIAFSKPEKSHMFRILSWGLMLAFFIMILHVMMLGQTIIMRQTHNIAPLNILYCLYCICYVGELDCIITYLIELSYKRRLQAKSILIFRIALSVIYSVILLLPMIRRRLLIYDNGAYFLSAYADAYILCSFICGIVALVIIILNRNDVSRIIHWGSVVFTPVIIVVTVLQFHFHTAYFICATYTIPFIIYYTLFHANKYYDLSGCQGYDAYKTYLKNCLKDKTEFLQFSVTAPKLRGRDLTEINDILSYATNKWSRSVEKISSKIRVYNISPYRYIIICPLKNDDEAVIIKNKLILTLNGRLQLNNTVYRLLLNFVVSGRYDNVTSCDEYMAIVNHKEREFQNLNTNQILYVKQEDVEKYKRHALIERTLLEIKRSNKLDDERIILYIQPIYSIQRNNFRTGESLMRLKIDGQIVFPDEFIPIAESNDCIHTLTRIILYKVAKLTVKMNQTCDYDALTVNVSTIEMTSPTISDEFMGIIKHAGARPENIRMEITESTSITDYQRVISNIIRLKEMGISFYLDDFGTGYSNMDRVLSIPFTTIKFDKSLMYKAIEDKKTEELFNFLARYFKENGLSLVVEGVEDEKQRDYVIAAGFDYIQGYFYSKPLPAEEALKFFL